MIRLPDCLALYHNVCSQLPDSSGYENPGTLQQTIDFPIISEIHFERINLLLSKQETEELIIRVNPSVSVIVNGKLSYFDSESKDNITFEATQAKMNEKSNPLIIFIDLLRKQR